MGDREYLLSYGNAGDFGRFACAESLTCRRGDQVVVRSPRGQELGVIMRLAGPGHGRLLSDQFVGQILRQATEGDLQLAERMRRRGQRLFEDGRRLIRESGQPMEILDVEILLDGRQAVLHYLRWADCDPRSLMDALSQSHRLLITLHDLALPSTDEAEAHQEHASCGAGDCGKGECGSCSAGNCGSCVSHRSHSVPAQPAPVTAVATVRDAPARITIL
jgi:cell fate regulator YaaT (PSP1 superfamily)